MRKTIGLVLFLFSVTFAHAGTLSSTAKTEIDALLAKLDTSACQFYRNGSRHGGSEAKDHLRRKLDYLVARGRIDDAEQFIEKAATKSSLSGQPYKVRCTNGDDEPSAVWLGKQLRHLRETRDPSPRP